MTVVHLHHNVNVSHCEHDTREEYTNEVVCLKPLPGVKK